MSLGDTVFFAGRSEEYGIKLPKLPKPKVMSPKDFGKMLYKVTGIEGGVKAGQALAKCKQSDSKCIAKNLGNMAVAYNPVLSAKDRLSGIPGIGSKLGNVFDQVTGVGALKSSTTSLIRCKPNDAKCMAKGIAETGLAASSFVPGAGAGARAASIARTAAVTAGKAAAGAAKAAKAGKAAAGVAKAGKAAAGAAKTGAKLAGKGLKAAGEMGLDAAGGALDFAGDNAGALAGGAALLGAGALGAAAMSRMGGAGEATQGMDGGPMVAPGGSMGMAGGYGGMPGGYPYIPPAAPAPVIVPAAPAAPAAQAPPIKINIQISGKDMAASSGAFGDEIIGKPQPSGRASSRLADEEEEEAPSGGAKAALLGLAKGAISKKMSGGESFTLTGAPVERGVNWFAVIFFVMCILVLFFTSR